MQLTFTDKYFKLWMWVIPISSISIIPSIQATTPAYVLALFTLFFVFMLKNSEKPYFVKDFIMYAYVFILMNATAQFGLLFANINFDHASLIDYSDALTVMFRRSMFTQSLYFLATILTLLYVKHFFNEKWNRYIFRGAILLGAYGIFEFVYFLIFHSNGDFLSNRVIVGRIASLFSITNFSGTTIMRIKSLTGEPSMYAYTMLPFWIYAVHLKKIKTQLFILLTILLTFSGTAILGLIIYAALRLFVFMPKLRHYVFILPVLVTTYLLNYDWINVNFFNIFINKVQLEDGSGIERFGIFTNNISFYGSLNLFQQLFGVGFGYIRSTDYFSTVLVNNGIVGLCLLSLLFLYPVIKLKNTYENTGLKCAIVVTFAVMMISVPEIYYLSTWLFLGIAYYQLRAERILY